MVAEAIRVAMSERSERTKITLDRVLEELALIAFSDMRDFVTWGPNGVRLKASDELPEKVARCVSELAESPGKYGSSIRLKLHDKLAALDKLARHIGFFGEDSTGDFSDLARLSDEELGNLGRKLKLTS
jgi:phage terminase small subunit